MRRRAKGFAGGGLCAVTKSFSITTFREFPAAELLLDGVEVDGELDVFADYG